MQGAAMRNDTWDETTVQAVTQMWAAGKTSREIGDAVSKTRNAVIGLLRRKGISSDENINNQRRRNGGAVGTDQAAHAYNMESRIKAKRRSVVRPIPVPAVVELPDDPAVQGGVQFMDLEPHHCRWPTGDPSDADFHYCGRTRRRGSYCREHWDLSKPKPVSTDG